MKTVLILGAGFAGLELATTLSERVPDEVEVTIVDSSDAFVFGYSKLDLMFGRQTLPEVRLPYAQLRKPSVRFLRETVTAIDPERRRVTTDASVHEPDILVVALGADLDPAATPGLVEEGTEYYSVQGAHHVSRILPEFEGGDVIVGVLGPFFKCPAAPFETALMLHDFLEKRDLRSRSTIKVVSPMPRPIPISAEASQGILDALEQRGIGWWPESKITAMDPSTKTASLADGRTTPYDLLLGVPVHRAPRVVEESALAADDGWIPVDHTTFATRFEGVYAVGDITSAPVPRVGVIAEGEARTLAEVLVHQIRGGDHPAPYGGIATCYVEMGGNKVARFDADFLGGPSPVGRFTAASEAIGASKVEFGANRRRRWFDMEG
jgi:sulfide:quinone oxidoreductase